MSRDEDGTLRKSYIGPVSIVQRQTLGLEIEEASEIRLSPNTLKVIGRQGGLYYLNIIDGK